MCNCRNLFEFQERKIHIVTRLNKALGKADFRTGKRLGKNDHLVRWPKSWIRDVDCKTRNAMPKFITVREARFTEEAPEFHQRT
jgi:putative transposase